MKKLFVISTLIVVLPVVLAAQSGGTMSPVGEVAAAGAGATGARISRASADPAVSVGVVAATPPMGWNSYNCFGSAVHEDEVRANADYMAQHLKPFGWRYIVVDFLWSYDNPPGSLIGNASQTRLEDGSYIPWLAMDKWGRLTPNTNKFPCAFGGKGFKPLADYVHSQGLLFGIHVMRGIPRQAVWAHSPVENGGGITADRIADTSSTCDWENQMYGLDMQKPGAQEYLNSLLRLYADWGVDFIKVDDLSRPYHQAEIEGYRKAIEACKRPVVLSISPGETPIQDSLHVLGHANMWRMADDFWDSWPEVLKMFDYAKKWEGMGGPGHWPDCDMLQIGKISKRGPVGPERYSRFTRDELVSHMTFWCIYRSPLMIGGNLPEDRAFEDSLFTNAEVLAASRGGEAPRQLYKQDGKMVWASRVEGAGGGGTGVKAGEHGGGGADEHGGGAIVQSWYVALFNTGEAAQEVAVDFAQLGVRGKVAVRDCWKQADAGVYARRYGRMIPPHGAVLVKIKINK
jgi:alpha-galactosidase